MSSDFRTVLLVFFPVVCGAPANAHATDATPPAHALEAGLTLAISRMAAPSVNTSDAIVSTNGGFAGAFDITYRTPYFLSPFLEFGIWSLYASEKNTDLGSAGGKTNSQGRLYATSLIAGPAFDIWRIRLRAGIGVYNLHVSVRVAGSNISTSEFDMGYATSLSAFIVRTRRVQLGIEGRFLFIVEGGTVAWAAGPTMTFDAARW